MVYILDCTFRHLLRLLLIWNFHHFSLKLWSFCTRGLQLTKRCCLSWPTNSALVFEPNCGGMGELRGLSQWVQLHWSLNKLWRSTVSSMFCTFSHKKSTLLIENMQDLFCSFCIITETNKAWCKPLIKHDNYKRWQKINLRCWQCHCCVHSCFVSLP